MYVYMLGWTSAQEVRLETKAVLIDATVVVNSHGKSYQP